MEKVDLDHGSELAEWLASMFRTAREALPIVDGIDTQKAEHQRLIEQNEKLRAENAEVKAENTDLMKQSAGLRSIQQKEAREKELDGKIAAKQKQLQDLNIKYSEFRSS